MSRSGLIAGVVLAGGLSRRMQGQDKSQCLLGGKTLMQRVIDLAAPQVDLLVLNADPGRYSEYGLPEIADTIDGHAGPLAGVLAAMQWLESDAPDHEWLVSFATDTPFFPHDLATRLKDGAKTQDNLLACAASNGRTHPVFGLWHRSLRASLERALAEGVRKIDQWTAQHGCSQIDFAAIPYDPFFNVNRPEDLAQAEVMIQQHGLE